jgi:mono/diheme cytochrome c family protein
MVAVAVLMVPLMGLAVLRFKPVKVSPLWTETIERTPERLARGRYLATHVSSCMDCHSSRDWTRFAGPPIEGTYGGGGERFGHDIGFPGEVTSPNITPAANIARWSDGELVRAIREGVTPEGRVLAPIMPYSSFASMSDEDVRSIVVYLRSLSPVRSQPRPEPRLDFPLSLLVRGIPRPAGDNGRVPHIAPAPTVEYGRYLVTIGACAECHTPSQRGEPLPGMAFAGGQEFRMPAGVVRSANLTPHATGLGSVSEDAFVARFRTHGTPHREPAVPRPAPDAQPLPGNTIMPWSMYAGMTDDDLRAIYRYLRTVAPVNNTVVKFGT